MNKLLIVGIALFFVAGCTLLQRGPSGEPSSVEEAANAVAPLLPPPFGLIAGGLAAFLSGVASVGANKKSNAAYKKKEDPGLLVRLLTEHSWAMPTLAALAAAARAGGLIHFSDAELALFTSTLAVPVATKKVMRKKTA